MDSYTVMLHNTCVVQNEWALFVEQEKLIYTIYR